MNHKKTERYSKLLREAPGEIRDLESKQFELLKSDPKHPSLRFKKVGRIWSMRIAGGWRALAKREPDGIYYWYWIGKHDEYERKIRDG